MSSLNIRGIRNIVLDLGGVVVDLDMKRTIREFGRLGIRGLENADRLMSEHPFFRDYETGRISTVAFFEGMRGLSHDHVGVEDLERAWKTLVLDLQEDVLQLLRDMKKSFRICLLSNTNASHIDAMNDRLLERYGIRDFGDVFDRVYYSFRLGMRKPDREIFEFVLEDNGIPAANTLFIDDSSDNIESAAGLGISVYHLSAPEKLTQIFRKII